MSNSRGYDAPYTYQWSNGATTPTISNLTPGYYSVTVTGASGCTTQDTFCILSRGLDSVQTPLTGSGRSSSPLALEAGSQDGDILQWNQTAGSWEIAQPTGTGGSTNIGNQTAGGDIVLTPDPNKGVGIGTSNPTARFQVMSAGTAKDAVRFCASDPTNNQTELKVRETHIGQLRMEMKDATGQTVVQLHSDGANYFNNGSNFGIGIPNPSAQFDIRSRADGKVMQVRRSAGGKSLFEIHEFQGNAWLRMHDANGDRAFSFRTDGNSYINTDYKFGIGTTTPGAQFEVGSAASNNVAFKVSPSQTGWQRGFEVREEASGELELNLFDTNNDQQVRIAGEESYFEGKVGIGTNNPQAPLHVEGQAILKDLPIGQPNPTTPVYDIIFNPGEGVIRVPRIPDQCTDLDGGGDWRLGGNNVGSGIDCSFGTREGSGHFDIIAGGVNCIDFNYINNPAISNATFTEVNSRGTQLRSQYVRIGGGGLLSDIASEYLNTGSVSANKRFEVFYKSTFEEEVQINDALLVNGNSYISGNVGIGTTNPTAKLFVEGDAKVNGSLCAREFYVRKNQGICWPDYVFADDWKMKSVDELEAFIKQNKHLPGIPSATELEDGYEMVEMNRMMMEKIEELHLYVIELKKEITDLKRNSAK